jgi:hypothetical protein
MEIKTARAQFAGNGANFMTSTSRKPACESPFDDAGGFSNVWLRKVLGKYLLFNERPQRPRPGWRGRVVLLDKKR